MITLSPGLSPDSIDEQALDVRPELHVLALRGVLLADDVDVTAILVREHGLLVDQERILLRLAEETDAREEPGREYSVGIRHDGARPDRAGRRIERVGDEVHLALVREAFLVGEPDEHGVARVARAGAAAVARELLVAEVGALIARERHVDGIHGHDGRQQRLVRRDEVARLHERFAGAALDRAT